MSEVNEPKAYLIGGHGSELDTYFIVPDGCTIVVKMAVGELNIIGNYNKAVTGLCSIDKESLLDPERYSNTIIKNIGSVAIYKAGDKCPSFEYSLTACFNRINLNTGIINDYYSYCMLKLGVSDITSNNSLCDIYTTIPKNVVKYITKASNQFSAISNDNKIIKFISDFYNLSEYPRKDEVITILNEIKKDVPSKLSGNERITYYLDKLENHKKLIITQEDLCKINPGIYYNFVCRQKENIFPTNLNSVVSLINRKNNIVGKVLRNRISETFRRKPYIKKYYNSPSIRHEMTNTMLRNAGWTVQKTIREKEYNNEGNEIENENNNTDYITNNEGNKVSYLYILDTTSRPKNNSGQEMDNDRLLDEGWKIYNDGHFVKIQRTRPTYKMRNGGRLLNRTSKRRA